MHIVSATRIIKTLPGCSLVPTVRGGKGAEDGDQSEMTGSNRPCPDSKPGHPPKSPTAGVMDSDVSVGVPVGFPVPQAWSYTTESLPHRGGSLLSICEAGPLIHPRVFRAEDQLRKRNSTHSGIEWDRKAKAARGAEARPGSRSLPAGRNLQADNDNGHATARVTTTTTAKMMIKQLLLPVSPDKLAPPAEGDPGSPAVRLWFAASLRVFIPRTLTVHPGRARRWPRCWGTWQ